MTQSLPFVRIGAALLVVTLLGAFVSYRFERAGQWLPSVPDTIGAWGGTDTPISESVLGLLGYPKALGRDYQNPLGENVFASVVCAGPFENYHDPTVCIPGNGFTLTARRDVELAGPGSGKARAMIFRRGDIRIVMYYWQQNHTGTTDTAARMGTYKDIAARFRTGYSAVVEGNQTVLMRVYCAISPNDKEGAQAQRNVAEVSRALYLALKEEGEKGKRGSE